METKVCRKCKEQKSFNLFYRKSDTKDKLTSCCKVCVSVNCYKYRLINRDLIREKDKINYSKNRVKIRTNQKLLRSNDVEGARLKEMVRRQKVREREGVIDKIKLYNKQYGIDNKEIIKEKGIAYRLKNKEKIKAQKQIYRDNNKLKTKESNRAYNKKNQDKIKIQKKEYFAENKKVLAIKRRERSARYSLVGSVFRLKKALRQRIRFALKNCGYKKDSKTEFILGVDFDVVKLHLSRQFTKGMSWDNYGKWHIDHIIPLSSGKTKDDIIKLCHYTNLQPLWAKDNLEKHDKIVTTQMKIAI